jgi:hypothetical protein
MNAALLYALWISHPPKWTQGILRQKIVWQMITQICPTYEVNFALILFNLYGIFDTILLR